MAAEPDSKILFSPPPLPSWAGLLLAGVAAGLQIATAESQSTVAGGIAVVLAVLSLIVGGYAVSLQSRNCIVLLVAAATSALAYLGIRSTWDAVAIMPYVMTGVALVAAVIVLMPRALQRVVVCGLVVFHFLGVLSSITSPPPQSWLSSVSWTQLFRHHLLFCYTNNAYQFYSPEPGPASLLWFCIETKDGQKTWYKVPRKPETHLDPLGVEFYRRLSITEATNQTYNFGPSAETLENRQRVFTIPVHPSLAMNQQYRPLQEHARRILASYVRHVAWKFDRDLESNPDSDEIQSIKVYRVLHEMLKPIDFMRNEDPFDKITYYPYFLGDFNTKGELKKHMDPMLYWIVPILRKPSLTIRPDQTSTVDNHLATHAGSDPFKE